MQEHIDPMHQAQGELMALKARLFDMQEAASNQQQATAQLLQGLIQILEIEAPEPLTVESVLAAVAAKVHGEPQETEKSVDEDAE